MTVTVLETEYWEAVEKHGEEAAFKELESLYERAKESYQDT